jgi:mannose PTS system EIIA component
MGSLLIQQAEQSRRCSRVIGIVLVSHGTFAEGLKNAAEMIVGPQERLLAVSMEPEADLAALRRRIEQAVATVGPPGEVLVLIDILGGSPANASARLASRGIPVICGTNLPMLLELLTQRDNATQEELTDIATQAAKEGVINLTRQLRDS